LDNGFLLEKRPGLFQPKRIENARILIANTPMDTDKIKVFGSRVKVDSVARVAELELAEKEKMKEKVTKILSHNINVFINRQLIYNYPEQLFADANCMAIEHADFEGIERLALVLGGEIVSTFDDPQNVKLGKCDLIEEVMIGEDRLLRFAGVPRGEACTIVLRGATQQILDEAERSLHDALCVIRCLVKKRFLICGAGAPEMEVACRLRETAHTLAGVEAYCIRSFADALEIIPYTLAENAGLNPIATVTELRNRHAMGEKAAGINVRKGRVTNIMEENVLQPLLVSMSAINLASETVRSILKIDDMVRAVRL
jgi:T-complex protein 1 subunit beta